MWTDWLLLEFLCNLKRWSLCGICWKCKTMKLLSLNSNRYEGKSAAAVDLEFVEQKQQAVIFHQSVFPHVGFLFTVQRSNSKRHKACSWLGTHFVLSHVCAGFAITDLADRNFAVRGTQITSVADTAQLVDSFVFFLLKECHIFYFANSISAAHSWNRSKLLCGGDFSELY